MSKEYVFLADVDGTLLRTNQPVAPEVVRAAQAFTQKGGRLAICTGRTILATSGVAKAIGVNTPSVLNSGAAIYDFNQEKFIWYRAFSKEIYRVLYAIYEGYRDVSLQAYALYNVYNLRKTVHMEETGIYEEKSLPVCTIKDIRGDILKLGISCPDKSRLFEIKDKYIDPNEIEFEFASEFFVEMTPKDVHKGTSMELVSKHLDIPLSRFFVAGNAMTDIAVLQQARISFVPEDAPEAVKQVCTHVIPKPERAGMKVAFEYAAKYMETGI